MGSYDAHPSFKFAVEIDHKAMAAFTECTLPGFQIDTEKITEGGLNDYIHVLPKAIQAGNITLKHGIAKDDAMLHWYLLVLRGQFKDALKTVTIVMYGEDNKPVSTFTFENCYPVKWQGPSLNSGSTTVAIEEIQLAYHSVQLE